MFKLLLVLCPLFPDSQSYAGSSYVSRNHLHHNMVLQLYLFSPIKRGLQHGRDILCKSQCQMINLLCFLILGLVFLSFFSSHHFRAQNCEEAPVYKLFLFLIFGPCEGESTYSPVTSIYFSWHVENFRYIRCTHCTLVRFLLSHFSPGFSVGNLLPHN